MKKLFLKFFIFTVLGALVTMNSCNDYEDDISKLDTEFTTLRSTALAQSDLTAVRTQLDGSIAGLQSELNAAKTKLAALEAKSASAATTNSLDSLKNVILATTVKLETFNTFKTQVDADLVTLKADLAKASTKEELDALKTLHESELAALRTELGAKIANLEGILKVADGKSQEIEDIKSSLTAHMAEISQNKADIVLLKADLQAKFDELTGITDHLRTDLNNVADNLAALDQRVTDIRAELLNEMADMESDLRELMFDLYSSLDKRVYSLTFIPDYTSDDGTPQIVVRGITEWKGPKYRPTGTPKTSEYWEELVEGTIYKGITILRYNVSPSNVTLDDFEIAQLLHKTSLLRSANTKSDFIVLAGDATYSNGVLSVPVAVEANTYDLEDSDWYYGYYLRSSGTPPNVSVALQVENLNVENGDTEHKLVTSSEYVKANFDLSEGGIALNNHSLKTDGTLLPYDITYVNIAGAGHASDIELWNGRSQSGNTTDVLNHTINLNDYIYGVFDDYYGDWSKMHDFGFNSHKFVFRLVSLPNEGTNQSMDYVTLDPATGVIGVKPAGTIVNSAAVGRTPVVEVTAVVNGKVHAVGYIKIIISDKFDKSDVEFEFNLQDYMLGCNSNFSLTNVDLDAIDFDQVFNHDRIQLGKDAFFAEYMQTNLTDADVTKVTPPTPSAATVGIIGGVSQHVEFGWNIHPETQSTMLNNYLQGFIRNDAPVGTYKVKTRLKSNGYRPDVVITWNFKVTLPTGISLIPNSIYYKNGGIIVNPTIFEQGAQTSTTYEAFLNNTFMHESGNFDYEGLTQTCQDYLTPYFIFTSVPSGFTISVDKKSVWKGGQKAAEIVQLMGDRFYIRLNNVGENAPAGPWGNHTPFSDAAKQLVGKTVKVQPMAHVNGQPLNVINLFNAFDVHFRLPLEFDFPEDAVVFDQANDGVHNIYTLNLYQPSIIKDWNNKLISVMTSEGRDLIEHYEIHFDIDWFSPWQWPSSLVYHSPFVLGTPQINLQSDGTIGASYRSIPLGTDMKIEINNVVGQVYSHPLYGPWNVPASITFEWSNSSTGEVQNEFMVRIPVSVSHKWSPANEPLMDYLYIKVKPGNGQ